MSSVPHVRRIGKALYYRDTLVGKGSDLAKAIEDKNAAKAEAIYQTCMAAVRTPPEWLRELLKLRERAIGEGMPLLSANEINEEVAQRRGFR